jgi:hypothetical protein
MSEDESFRVYIMRYEDRTEWRAKAKGGDENARICQWAASKWMRARPTEHAACSCCDMVFSATDEVRALLILISTNVDPDKIKAKAGGVCAECSKHDDKWIVDQSARREGLSAATRRSGDQLH